MLIQLSLEVTDVLCLAGIKGKVADRSNEGVDTQGDVSKNNVCEGSRLPTVGLKRGVVDDKATNPTKEEGKKETNYVVIHRSELLS